MEYRVDGIVKFYHTIKLKLEVTLDFSSPSGARITLNSTNDNDLAVGISLEADSKTAAKEMAKVELNKISSLLSYFYDIPISESKITEMVSVLTTPEGKHITCIDFGVVSEDFSLVKGNGPEFNEKLCHRLEHEYPSDFEDVVSMWKEAISVEAPALRYLLLYRLMECLFKSDTKKLTAWIRNKEPSVKISCCDWRKRDITDYTRLRDNIHRKQEQFPFKEIHDALPKLQNLVKQAIEEKIEGQQECSAKSR